MDGQRVFLQRQRILKEMKIIKGVKVLAEIEYYNQNPTGYRQKRRKKTIFAEIEFLRILRLIFFLSLSFLLVYVYYLYSIGILQKTLSEVWNAHKKTIISLSLFFAYSVMVFRVGVWKGRR